MVTKQSTRLVAALAVSALLFSACTASRAYRRGRSEAQAGNWDNAVVHFTRAANESPDSIEYRIALDRALVEAAALHVKEGQKKLAAEDNPRALAFWVKPGLLGLLLPIGLAIIGLLPT